MHIILGAGGRVGGGVAECLVKVGCSVRSVVRNPKSASCPGDVVQADYFDKAALAKACRGGSSIFLLTPENPASEHPQEDVATLLENYHHCVVENGIKRVVLLSSMGAHAGQSAGNLEYSYRLEHAFDNLAVEKVCIRPAYYYSNWFGYVDLAKEYGILPTFFPPEFSLPMVSPSDVAAFAALAMQGLTDGSSLYEVVGPRNLSSNDVAQQFSNLLGKLVQPSEVPAQQWRATLKQAGFSTQSAEGLALMTQAVLDGRTKAVTENPIQGKTSLGEYLEQMVTR